MFPCHHSHRSSNHIGFGPDVVTAVVFSQGTCKSLLVNRFFSDGFSVPVDELLATVGDAIVLVCSLLALTTRGMVKMHHPLDARGYLE